MEAGEEVYGRLSLIQRVVNCNQCLLEALEVGENNCRGSEETQAWKDWNAIVCYPFQVWHHK